MRADRRQLLAGFAAVLALPRAARAASAPTVLGARVDGGRAFVTALTAGGDAALDLALPGRGHGFAIRPDGGEAVAPARRPGAVLTVVDLAEGRIARTIAAPAGRHFNGHAAYSADGGRLYVTETVLATDRGMVGIHDARHGHRRIGSFPSGGRDPHDIRLLPDGRTLAVANGGIPDNGGDGAPDLDRMDSTLAFIDAASGRIDALHRLPPALGPLGMRHLAVARDGTVAVVMQHEGPAAIPVPLIALATPGGLRLVTEPRPAIDAMRLYCGSAAIDREGSILAVSSPKGGVVTFWRIADGTLVDVLRARRLRAGGRPRRRVPGRQRDRRRAAARAGWRVGRARRRRRATGTLGQPLHSPVRSGRNGRRRRRTNGVQPSSR
ncbi:MAG: DUF1513 domain-containing protein [Alphaproteobacteria bacterium]